MLHEKQFIKGKLHHRNVSEISAVPLSMGSYPEPVAWSMDPYDQVPWSKGLWTQVYGSMSL